MPEYTEDQARVALKMNCPWAQHIKMLRNTDGSYKALFSRKNKDGTIVGYQAHMHAGTPITPIEVPAEITLM